MRESTEIGHTYLFLNNAYARLSSILTTKDEAGAFVALNKAEKYFCLGGKVSVSNRSLEQSSRILAIAYSYYGLINEEQKYFDRAIN